MLLTTLEAKIIKSKHNMSDHSFERPVEIDALGSIGTISSMEYGFRLTDMPK